MPAIVRPPRIVYVPGVWDLLHAGHLNLLWRARALGDVLVVGVVEDAGVSMYKGRPPEQMQSIRAREVGRLHFVDVAVLQRTTDPSPQVERFRPKFLVHGDDWQRLIEGNETLQRLGVELVLLPYTQGVSTTLLRQQETVR